MECFGVAIQVIKAKRFYGDEGVEMDEYNILDTDPSKMLEYKRLIIGCPTWHIGELQDDWDFIYEKYKELDFSGITAAFFGCGDQVGYADNFLDAIGLLAKPFMENGGYGLPKSMIMIIHLQKMATNS